MEGKKLGNRSILGGEAGTLAQSLTHSVTYHSPPPLLQLHTRIIVHAQTAAQQQSNGSYEARMSGKCGEWRDLFIMTLSPIRWVPVQDKGSKILCVKLGAMKVTPSDPLNQEYLTINLGSTSD